MRRALLLLALCLGCWSASGAPFEYQNGLIWLTVRVDGAEEPLRFLLDSGAGVSVIDTAAARRAGVKLGARQTVRGVSGEQTAQRVDGFRGTVAGMQAPGKLLALDLSAVSQEARRRIDGLLGADFFRGRIVQIDYARRVVRFPSRAETGAGSGERLPLAVRGDALCTRASVNGEAEQWVRVDTGCDTGVRWVANTAASAGRKNGEASVGVTAGGAQGRIAEVRLGELRLGPVSGRVQRERIFAGEGGLLGNGVLGRFVVTVDVTGKALWLRGGGG
jgi:predicted aspartyl protease